MQLQAICMFHLHTVPHLQSIVKELVFKNFIYKANQISKAKNTQQKSPLKM